MMKVIALKGARYSGDLWSRARAFISSGVVGAKLAAAKTNLCGALG